VQVNQEVRIFVEGEAEPITARVTRVSPGLEMASRSLIIEADVPNPAGRWRAGLFAQAAIVVDQQARVLAVPNSAITEFAGVQKVWLVRNQVAQGQRVVTGRREHGLAEILAGLAAGDTVLAEGQKGRAGPVTPLSTP
jgi:hypothetical protein